MSRADDRAEDWKRLACASSLVDRLIDGEGTHEQRADWARKAAQYLMTYARREEAKHQEEHKRTP